MAESVEQDRNSIDAFFEYLTGIEADDERYGQAVRHDGEGGLLSVLHFSCGPSQWIEVAVMPESKEVRVGFVTGDPAVCDDIAEGLKQTETTLDQFVESEFANAGLSWPGAAVEHLERDDGTYSYTTSFTLEYFDDLDQDEIRDKVMRMLEGYLTAFAPPIEPEDGDEEE